MPQVIVIGARLRWNLEDNSPHIAGRRFDLDHVGAEIGEDHRSAWARNEAREVHHLQSGKNVVACHGCPSSILVSGGFLHRPWNWGARFSRKADVPSFLSSVAAQR